MAKADQTYIHRLLAFDLITPTSLAVKMWPHLSQRAAYNKLYNKLNEVNSRRVTDEDIQLAKKVCQELKLFI